MTKAIIFSDYHAHLWAEFSQPTGDKFINSRFKEQVRVLDTILSTAQQAKQPVIFAGDLFHKRVNVHTTVFNVIFDKFREYSDVPVLMVRGNHDSVNNAIDSDHSLQPFKALPNVLVADTPQVVPFMGTNVACLPYGDDIKGMKEFLNDPETQKASLLVAHIGVEGAKESSGHSLEGAFTLSDLHSENYDYVILGHYHKHQFLNTNTFYVGNTVPTSFSDTDEKGFVRIDTDNMLAVLEPVKTHQFLTLNEDEVDPETIHEVMANNYVRLRASKTTVNSLEHADGGIPSTVRVEVAETFEAETRIGITVDDTASSIVESYLDEYYIDLGSTGRQTVLKYINTAQQGGN